MTAALATSRDSGRLSVLDEQRAGEDAYPFAGATLGCSFRAADQIREGKKLKLVEVSKMGAAKDW